jgi:hypothetical protein
MAAKAGEQNLAVFGVSGSGKTVLLSSFYGASQEPSFPAESLYKVLGHDTGQGTRLRQDYLRMRNKAEAPEASRFTATPYSFTLKLTGPRRRQGGQGKALRRAAPGLARLSWPVVHARARQHRGGSAPGRAVHQTPEV